VMGHMARRLLPLKPAPSLAAVSESHAPGRG
jgi:hypothetical protein